MGFVRIMFYFYMIKNLFSLPNNFDLVIDKEQKNKLLFCM